MWFGRYRHSQGVYDDEVVRPNSVSFPVCNELLLPCEEIYDPVTITVLMGHFVVGFPDLHMLQHR